MRLLVFFVSFSLWLTQTAFAQANPPTPKAAPRPVTAPHLVTILSDGTSDPNGAASQVLSEIAITLDKESDFRVLSISGYGGATNARDLLQLRGADLAVVNHDVLAYLDLSQTLPEARRKIRLITPLFHQRVLLFARQDVKTIEELRGRKVGTPSVRTSRGVTAKAVFGSLKMNVEFVELDNKDFANRTDLDAILLFENDLPDLKALGILPRTYHLLSIPASNGPLTKVYLPVNLGKEPVLGFSSDQAIETIQVSTVLAAFDWGPKQGRYADVVSFVEKFFALLPKMRKAYPNSPLARIDIKTMLPGWQRFAPAQTFTASAPGAIGKEASQAPLWNAEALPAKEPLRLLALSHPPLTDAQQTDGGVALKLLTEALESTNVGVSVQWADGEKAFLEGLLSKQADAGIFWQTLNCDAPGEQSASGAVVCDKTAFSEPVMLAVLGVFTRLDAQLSTPSSQDSALRTLCIPENQPISEGTLDSIPWLKGAQVKTLRMKAIIDCIAALDRHEAEALIALEPEGRFVIEKLKLTQSLQLSQRIETPMGLHVLVEKANPRQAILLQTINEAVSKFRASSGYSQVIASHISDLTGSTARMP
jgi:hypothetical protein